MIAFMRGIPTPVSITAMPVSLRMVSNSGGYLGVAVADEELGWAGGVLQVHGEVADGVGDPCRAGVGGGAQDPNAAGGVIDHGQRMPALAGQRHHFEAMPRAA
jgi:hypothetical protein